MASSPAHPNAALTVGVSSGVVRAQFDVFDDVVRLAAASGVLAVSVPHTAEVLAIAGHTERRARAASRDVVRGAFAHVDSAWRDVASRLGVDPLPHDPAEAARGIVTRAVARRAVVVVPMLGSSAWDEALCDAIAAEQPDTLFVLVAPRRLSLKALGWSWFEIESRLDAAGLSRFWDAVAQQQQAERGEGLAELEAWLQEANAVELGAARQVELGAEATQLLERLRLAQRAWPLRQLGALGGASGLDELASAQLVEVRDGLAVAYGEQPAAAASGAAHVAGALAECFPEDAWARARGAELLAASGSFDAAEEHMLGAMLLAADASSRSTLWRRWGDLVESRPEAERVEARTRGAELALSLGDVEVALAWAQRASAGDGSARAAFILGRAALARGDLVSADAALRRARELGANTPVASRALVELAEVHYAAGELELAESLAEQVLESTELASVRLGARNVLGKLLLARARWSDADAHFASDACDAAFAGELVSELRARVNRAIALLSRGSPDEARPMLEKVLSDAEERGELRAVGFALSNLAVLAIERHEYAHALELSERAIVVRRQLGDRLGFARDVTNLVELRLRLGLVEQAEQALRFGRQALGPGAPASRLAELALAAARVHLARGRTLEAEREVRVALRTARHASDGDKLGECHRLAARVSLEDGVTARAEEEVARARELMEAPFAKAEVALLEGRVARASGRAAAELAQQAVMLARESGDDELAREAHLLAAETALTDGNETAAADHIAAAAALRDEVAAGLSPDQREAYLARGDMLELARLEGLTELCDELEPESVRPSVRMKPAAGVASSFVGRHPSVRGLLTRVSRVGPTGAMVLIRGESGTGKELIAEGIHSASERSAGPLVKVNCAALVESLLLSELFGHEKGAFTGAGARKRGRFERASGGTLFLDEIGDISERTQVALLRVLEEHTIERVGGSSPIAVDVRIVCATNRDLRSMVERGEFREDLYYRLSGITLEVPALRERVTDLPLLCDAILGRIARERAEEKKAVSSDALELLARHRWPGNVRELENALRVASLFADTAEIGVSDFIEHVEVLRKVAADPASIGAARGRGKVAHRPSVPPPAGVGLDSVVPVHDVPVTGAAYREIKDSGMSLSELKRHIERECIARALDETDGNITRAAEVLGMKRPRLSQLVKQYNLLSGDGKEDAS